MKFKDIKIRNKILLLVTTLLFFMLAISLTSYWGMQGLDEQSHIIMEHAYEFEEAGDLQVIIGNIVMPVNDYLITGDLEGAKKEYNDHKKEFIELIGKIQNKAGLEDHEKDLINKIDGNMAHVDKFAQQIFAIGNINVDNRGVQLMLNLDKEAEEVVEMAEKFHENVSRQIKNAEAHADEESQQTFMILLGISAFSIVFGFFMGLLFSNNISKSIKMGLTFANKLADGDLTERIDLNQKDELGQLCGSLNSAAENLEELVSNVMVGSQNLSQAVQEISSGNQNLSQRTSEQASSLEEIAATVEEATAAINQNAENADKANHQSMQSSTLASSGGQLVEDAVSSINEINQTSKQIGEIISVINDISFQTNLLALNAAVEAARAGEQGRGFAVVAGEVRNLAQRSGNSAKEIGDLIKDSINKIETGTEKANKSGESLKNIIESVNNVSKVISEIAAASNEQRQGISQINTAITEMDTMTQQNSALVEETASASEEMANQAVELLQLVQKFKVNENAAVTKKFNKIQIHKVEEKQKPNIPITEAAKTQQDSNLKNTLQSEGFEEF